MMGSEELAVPSVAYKRGLPMFHFTSTTSATTKETHHPQLSLSSEEKKGREQDPRTSSTLRTFLAGICAAGRIELTGRSDPQVHHQASATLETKLLFPWETLCNTVFFFSCPTNIIPFSKGEFRSSYAFDGTFKSLAGDVCNACTCK